jgi:triosephosphate isomerase
VRKITPLIVANWKSFIASPKEGLALIKAIDKSLPRTVKSKLVVCPPALLTAYIRDNYAGKRMAIGVQDISLAPQGAHTGEVTATLARASGAEYAIIGHAERRAQGETNEEVALEVRTALDARLIPVICIGEAERGRDGSYLSVIEHMLIASLKRLQAKDISKIVIAYEPVWAIGATTAPDARVVHEAVLYVRKLLVQHYGRDLGMKVKILYGGAVDDTTARVLLDEGYASGFLVGRASVDAKRFVALVRACES